MENLPASMEKMRTVPDPLDMVWPLWPVDADTSMMYSFPLEMTPVPFPQDLAHLSYITPPHLDYYYSALYSYLPCQSSLQNSGNSDVFYGPAYIRKRNERERRRVKCVNEGYAKLRRHLPQEYKEKRLSKVQTLRAAISYIGRLQEELCWGDAEGTRDSYKQHSEAKTANTYQTCEPCDFPKRSQR